MGDQGLLQAWKRWRKQYGPRTYDTVGAHMLDAARGLVAPAEFERLRAGNPGAANALRDMDAQRK